MRKLLLLVSVLCANIAAAQQVNHVRLVPANPKTTLRTLPKPQPAGNVEQLPATSAVPSSQKHSSSSELKTSGLRESEAILGNTVYDVQTNRAMSNRIIRNTDGTLSAVWTTLCEGGNSGTDRGTGYNYFDGTSWLPSDCHKIEPSNRSGFTNIGVTSSNKEIVIAHSSTAGGMLLTSRPTKGTGAWTEDPTALGSGVDDTWAKMVVDGNNVHAIWNASGTTTNEYCGQVGAVVYSRSTDGGATWPVLHECLAPIDTPFYLGFSADDYSIDAQGNNVAILVGEWTTDLVLLKSTDNGDTWTKQILSQFPIPLYDDVPAILDTNNDAIPDTLFVQNGDGRVMFDNTGKMQVVFSKVLILDDDPTAGPSYYPSVDGGIWYWNESMGSNPPVLIAAAEDLNGDSLLDLPVINPSGYPAGIYVGGLSLQPTIGFDESNNVYVTYATYDELADTLLGAGHRHVYTIMSSDGGQTWTTPFDVVPSAAQGGDGEFEEGVYADMAKVVDGQVHIVYQRDGGPGVGVNNTNASEAGWNTNPSDIVYAGVTIGELTSTGSINTPSFSVSQNIPNPASDVTVINVDLPSSAEVKLNVYDLLGQEVFAIPMSNYSSGQHSISLDCSKLNSGVYFYKVTAGAEEVTRKMIVE